MNHLDLELEHIYLEIKQQRGHHLRHFVDRYFCYKHGYINKNGIAKWDDIFWNEWVSIEALNHTDKKLVTKEHVVPLKVITKKLLDIGSNCTKEEITSILDKYLVFATITKEEDKRIRSIGLNSKMAEGFYKQNHKYYDDVFCRYKAANIKVNYLGNQTLKT